MDDKTKQYTEKAKGWASKMKRMSDDAVGKYGEKLPDSVTKAYGKASDTAGKYLPGEGNAAAESDDAEGGDDA
jgi:hypothetical protein